jgi:hypothetical protein
MDGVIHGSLLRKLPKNKVSKTRLKTRSDPAQQRQEVSKVPDILVAEFSRLTPFFGLMVFG